MYGFISGLSILFYWCIYLSYASTTQSYAAWYQDNCCSMCNLFFSNTIKDFLLSLIFCRFTVKCLYVAHNLNPVWFWECQFSSVAQSCTTLCDPINHSTPGLSVHHQFPEFTQTHVHPVSDAIQPSHPLSSPSPPAPNPSQHQSLFQWVNSSHEVHKVLEFQL